MAFSFSSCRFVGYPQHRPRAADIIRPYLARLKRTNTIGSRSSQTE